METCSVFCFGCFLPSLESHLVSSMTFALAGIRAPLAKIELRGVIFPVELYFFE